MVPRGNSNPHGFPRHPLQQRLSWHGSCKNLRPVARGSRNTGFPARAESRKSRKISESSTRSRMCNFRKRGIRGGGMKTRIPVNVAALMMSALLVLSTGCATNPDGTKEYKRTAIGALGGAAVGAGAGALIAGRGHRGTGALIGGVVGAAGGGAIGNYMDRQAAEMK